MSASPTSRSEEAELFARGFDALEEGARFTTPPRAVSEEDVLAFAELTGDHHPLHVDAAFAAQGPFGAQIAHGLLVLSRAAGSVPFDPRRVLALRRVRDAVFKRPVFLGDQVRVDGRIASLKPVDERAGLVGVALDTKDGQGRTVMRATVEVLWARDG